MTDVLPIIRDLEDCETDQERAAWLNTCRLNVFEPHEILIRERLRHARFAEGLRLLDTELDVGRRQRRVDGTVFGEMELGSARGRIHRIALGLPPRW